MTSESSTRCADAPPRRVSVLKTQPIPQWSWYMLCVVTLSSCWCWFRCFLIFVRFVVVGLGLSCDSLCSRNCVVLSSSMSMSLDTRSTFVPCLRVGSLLCFALRHLLIAFVCYTLAPYEYVRSLATLVPTPRLHPVRDHR